MKTDLETIQNYLKEILSAYGRRDSRHLRDLAVYSKWRVRAQEELDQRVPHFLNRLHNEALAAIANGDLDISALALEVAQILENN